MADIITITANWSTGNLSSNAISRQYDNNRYRIQFVGYPEDGTENLIFYLLVWMRTENAPRGTVLAPIRMDSDQWTISNYFTQIVQQIRFQLCLQNEAGTFEAHSPIFTGTVMDSLEHDGEDIDIDTSALFDYYREYVNNLIVAAGAVVIDTDLDTAGAAADAKAVGDALTGLNGRLSDLEQSGGSGAGIPTEVRQAIYTILTNGVYNSTGLTDEKAVLQSWAMEITEITLNKSSESITGAGTSQLTATTSPAGGLITWSSSNPAVATVSSTGLVTGVGNGTAKIAAHSGGKKAECVVTVTGFANLIGITATYTQSGTVYTTDALSILRSDLTVVASYDDSTSRTITDYTLSGSLAVGTSHITASYGGFTDTFDVLVTADDIWRHTPLYPLEDGTHTFTNATYGGVLEIEDGVVTLTRTTDTSIVTAKCSLNPLTTNGSSLQQENRNQATTTMFTIPANAEVTVYFRNVRRSESGSFSEWNFNLTNPTDKWGVDIAHMGTDFEEYEQTVTMSPSFTEGYPVACVGCNLNFSGNGAWMSFEVAVSVNGERWI